MSWAAYRTFTLEVEASLAYYMAALDAGVRAEADATPIAKERLADSSRCCASGWSS